MKMTHPFWRQVEEKPTYFPGSLAYACLLEMEEIKYTSRFQLHLSNIQLYFEIYFLSKQNIYKNIIVLDNFNNCLFF